MFERKAMKEEVTRGVVMQKPLTGDKMNLPPLLKHFATTGLFLLLCIITFSFLGPTASAQGTYVKLFSENDVNLLIGTTSKMIGAGDEASLAFDLVLQSKTTGLRRTIAESPTVLAASFSPDNQWITYTTSLENIHVASVFETTQFFVNGFSVGVAWSPDSKILSYVKRDDLNDDESDIWVLDLRTRKERQLTRKSGHHSQPVISPDGDRILFVSTRTGVGSLWLLDLRTKSEMQVTNQGLKPGRGRPDSFVPLPCCGGGPLWSYSDKLVWPSEDGIWALDLNTKAARKIHNERGSVRWVVEGQEVAIESERGMVRKRVETR